MWKAYYWHNKENSQGHVEGTNETDSSAMQ